MLPESERRELFNDISRRCGILEKVLASLARYYGTWEHDRSGAEMLRDNPECFIETFRRDFPGIFLVDRGMRVLPLVPPEQIVRIGDLRDRPHFGKKMADRLTRTATVVLWRRLVKRELEARGMTVELPSVAFVKQRVRTFMDAFKKETLQRLGQIQVGGRSIGPRGAIKEFDFPSCSYVIPLGHLINPASIVVTRAWRQEVHAEPIVARRTDPFDYFRNVGPSFAFHGVRFKVFDRKEFGAGTRDIIRPLPQSFFEELLEAMGDGVCRHWSLSCADARYFIDTRPSSPGSRKGGYIVVFSKFPLSE